MILKETFDLITSLASVFGFLGGFYLVRSILKTGAEEIVGMSSTFWGKNPILLKTYTQQKVESMVGFGHTTLSGICWLASAFLAIETKATMYSFSLVLILLISLVFISEKIIKTTYFVFYEKVNLNSFAQHIDGYFRSYPDGPVDVDKLIRNVTIHGLAHHIISTNNKLQNLVHILELAGDHKNAKRIIELPLKKKD